MSERQEGEKCYNRFRSKSRFSLELTRALAHFHFMIRFEGVVDDYSGVAEGLSRAPETPSSAHDDIDDDDDDDDNGRRVDDEVTGEHDGDHRGRTSGR